MNEDNSPDATTFTTPTDREIVMTRVFDAPRRLVWEAWTNPEHLPHWMLGPEGWTMPVCEIDLRPAARGTSSRDADGNEMEMRGVYREVVPPERLVSTESWGGDWPETLNTLILSEEAGKTTVTQRILYPSKEARDRRRVRDEGRHEADLPSPRQAPADDGLRPGPPARGRSVPDPIAGSLRPVSRRHLMCYGRRRQDERQVSREEITPCRNRRHNSIVVTFCAARWPWRSGCRWSRMARPAASPPPPRSRTRPMPSSPGSSGAGCRSRRPPSRRTGPRRPTSARPIPPRRSRGTSSSIATSGLAR